MSAQSISRVNLQMEVNVRTFHICLLYSVNHFFLRFETSETIFKNILLTSHLF